MVDARELVVPHAEGEIPENLLVVVLVPHLAVAGKGHDVIGRKSAAAAAAGSIAAAGGGGGGTYGGKSGPVANKVGD